MRAKLTPKNRLTLPKAVVSNFEDVRYFDVTKERGWLILMQSTSRRRAQCVSNSPNGASPRRT